MGVIAKMIYPGKQGGGFIASMFFGIIGAFIDGSLFRFVRAKSYL